MTSRARLILLLLVVPLSAMLLLLVTPPVEDLSLESERWTGLKDVASVLDVLEEEWEVAALEDEPVGSTLLVVPRKPFRAEEVSHIGAFVERGGNVLVIDDFGYGNQLLNGLGLDVTITGGTLVDPVNCVKNESMPLVAASPPGHGDGTMVLALNHASWLKVGQGAQAWATSSRFSFDDANGNGLRDREETAGPLNVAATCALGEGTVHVVSDASIVINAMVNEADNAIVLRAVAGDRVLIDMSRLPDTGADAGKRFLSQVRRTSGSVAGLSALLLGLASLALLYPWYNRGRHYER